MLPAENIQAELQPLVAGDVYTDIIHRTAYSVDASIYQIMPQCIVCPRDLQDIVTVVRHANPNGIAIVPRGAGTGVAGESLCSGIVFDMRSYMNRILAIEDNGRSVVCEPGVVLDELNQHLAQWDRKIGPDPSTGNRATIGGCVANNATGAHSLQYGYMSEYVRQIEAVLADGSVAVFCNDTEVNGTEESFARQIVTQCHDLLRNNSEVISQALPRTQRNRSGYTIADICHNGRMDMARLLAGSEGTLAVFTKITLQTVPVPKAKGLIQFEFDSLEAMGQAVPLIVDSGAAACELMDKTLMNIARDALPHYKDILPDAAQALLLVEHIGETEDQVREKIDQTNTSVASLARKRLIVLDPTRQDRLWKMRKDAVPLLGRAKGKKHPVPFIEDISVENTKLCAYIRGLDTIGRKYNITMNYYGHAGDGELHIRPYLDLGRPEDIEKMQQMANDVFALAWSLGGSISGEHGDGLVRAAFIKQQYGPAFYELLRKIKHIFDPQSILNPGKIISDDADVMITNLKAAFEIDSKRLQSPLLFDPHELEYEIDQCSGCGLCVSNDQTLRMCPVYRAMGDELASSRAKVNLIRAWASGQIDDEEFESKNFSKFLDLCVNCKACSQQCPSGVDISKIITAARSRYVQRKGLAKTKRILSLNRFISILSSGFAPVSNFFMQLRPIGWFMDLLLGVDKRRKMPVFARGSFLKSANQYLAAQETIAEPIDKVVFFADTYVMYNDHELGFAVLDVLLKNNIEVNVPKQRPVPLPAICYGDVQTAKTDLQYDVRHLLPWVNKGYKIICSEPSAALALKEELRHYVTADQAELISQNTYELMDYLLGQFESGRLAASHPVDNAKIKARLGYNSFLYHHPCHSMALDDRCASVELLQNLCGIEIIDVQAGCCGIAGTFGMQKKNYELSEKIGDPLKQAILSSNIDIVLSECSTCRMQIEHLTGKVVWHPVKLLLQWYDTERSGS